MNLQFVFLISQIILIILANQVFNGDMSSSLRTYGGRDALRDEFPFVVRIEEMTPQKQNKKKFVQRCTGAALTYTWILSAAHCHFEGDYTNPYEKLVARYNSYFPKHKGNISVILEVKINPTYSFYIGDFLDMVEVLKNDLCLFRSEGISVSSYGKLSPVDYKSLVGHEANTLGFGHTNASQYQKPLQVLKGMLYDCTEKSKYVYMLCLMPQCGVQTTICGGDSGGPVVHLSGIVGVNSMSQGDCNKYAKYLDVPVGTEAAILALVSPNVDWISNIISNKSQQ